MRRRLRITYMSLLMVALLAFAIALAYSLAAEGTRNMFIDRMNDTARFAALAEPALQTRRKTALQDDMREYDHLFGIQAAVVDEGRGTEISSRDGMGDIGTRHRNEVDLALSGNRAQSSTVVWPWDTDPMVITVPVGTGGEIIGAAITVSPTDKLRAAIWQEWGVIAGGALLVLLAGAVAASPFTRWVVRPLRELDEATHAISLGHLDERVRADTGPPELRRFAQSFNSMADKLSSLIERQRAFVSYASHQLRTPLATVRLRVETLGDTLSEEGVIDHQLALEEVDRLSRIFDALLTFARAGADGIEMEDIDAGGIAVERVKSWTTVANRVGARLTLSGELSVQARAAGETLDQILDALIDNALKFGGKGSHVTVSVSQVTDADTDKRWVEIHVVDDGPGMAPDRLSQAAQPFWREPTARNVTGSGLGLTIVSALIAASRGRFDLLPASPRGLDARVRLLAADRQPVPVDPAERGVGRAPVPASEAAR